MRQHTCVGHRQSKPRSVLGPEGPDTHHCTLRLDPQRGQPQAEAVSVLPAAAGTKPLRVALSAVVPGDFPQSVGG